MYDILLNLGLQKYDFALLMLCPFGAVLGSLAHAILQLINPHRMPRPGAVRILSNIDAMGRFQWLMLRFVLGGILGLVVGLYFIGAIQENKTTLAKIVALSMLLGFAAPKLWLAQERVIADRAIGKLNELLGSPERKAGQPAEEPHKADLIETAQEGSRR